MRNALALAFAALLCAQPLVAQSAPRIAHKPVAGDLPQTEKRPVVGLAEPVSGPLRNSKGA